MDMDTLHNTKYLQERWSREKRGVKLYMSCNLYYTTMKIMMELKLINSLMKKRKHLIFVFSSFFISLFKLVTVHGEEEKTLDF